MTHDTHEEGVSEVIGAVLLVGLTVLGVAIVAAVLLSGPQTTEIPHATIVAGNESGNIVLVHEGGDPLQKGEYRIYLDTRNGLVDGTGDFTGPADGVWSIGEAITYTGSVKPHRVVVTAVTGGGETFLAEPAFDGGGAAVFAPDPVDPGAGGGAVTPGGENETPPVVIVIPELGTDLKFEKNGHYYSNVNANVTDPDIKRVDFVMYDYDTRPPKVVDIQPASKDPATQEYSAKFEFPPGQIKGVKQVVIMAIAFNDTAVVGKDACKVNITGT
ncbi:type IV pilin N-terminal domain-containing protein [Methanofollis ethanolicus]|uniref:type IV pilin N-terminal domain-containing protein n=1 Tax=Methanofollis ethanolicus TaxID=488124 RepID=UPI00082B678D|nr:type IV pilin N-terminal domain-containing protein [Methanofollis ethanolicus]